MITTISDAHVTILFFLRIWIKFMLVPFLRWSPSLLMLNQLPALVCPCLTIRSVVTIYNIFPFQARLGKITIITDAPRADIINLIIHPFSINFRKNGFIIIRTVFNASLALSHHSFVWFPFVSWILSFVSKKRQNGIIFFILFSIICCVLF